MTPTKRTSTSNNYISKGIDKKLLTPCRRVGLSRPKKTPRTRCADELTLEASTSNTRKKMFALDNDLYDLTLIDKHTSNPHNNVQIQPEIKLQVVRPKSPITCEFTVQHDTRRYIDFNDDAINNKPDKPKDVSASEHNSEDKYKCKKLKRDSKTKNSNEHSLKRISNRLTMKEHQAEQAKDPDLSQQYLGMDVSNLLENRTDVLGTLMFEESEQARPAFIQTSMENISVDQDQFALVHKSVLFEIESDDELFTSSPESDKNQRENLCKLISKTEREVKAKKETLESLKRAQTYKKLHNLEELQNSTEQWLQGCRLGLQDLLKKRQEQEEIQMETLVVKLRIPDDIIAKLNLS